jgi:hypothetical protein
MKRRRRKIVLSTYNFAPFEKENQWKTLNFHKRVKYQTKLIAKAMAVKPNINYNATSGSGIWIHGKWKQLPNAKTEDGISSEDLNQYASHLNRQSWKRAWI